MNTAWIESLMWWLAYSPMRVLASMLAGIVLALVVSGILRVLGARVVPTWPAWILPVGVGVALTRDAYLPWMLSHPDHSALQSALPIMKYLVWNFMMLTAGPTLIFLALKRRERG